nr:MAG: hypothetical protein DIU78_14470 [Pseudomonadota bacterium]
MGATNSASARTASAAPAAGTARKRRKGALGLARMPENYARAFNAVSSLRAFGEAPLRTE